MLGAHEGVLIHHYGLPTVWLAPTSSPAYDHGAIGRRAGEGDTEAVPIILRDLGASVSAFLFRNALNGRAT